MANKVLLKKSSVVNRVPTAGDLEYGELALNYADEKLYFKNSSNAVKSLNVTQSALTIGTGLSGTSYNGTSAVTIAIDSTVVTLAGSQTLTNKSLTSPTITGNITGDGAFTGFLKSLSSIGDEGGEILLAKPQTNSTIAGTGVTIDVYQNKLRIFEQGGTSRGVYIDLTAAGASVGSNLLSGGAVTVLSYQGDTGTDTLTVGSDTLTLAGGTGLTSTVTNNTVTFDIDASVATLSAAQTLTNKTISAASNTISGLTDANLSGTAGITNANLANSSLTIGTTAISLGASSTTLAGLTSVTSTSFVGALTGNASTATTLATGRTIALTGDVTYTSGSFNGSANVTGAATLATVNTNVGSFTNASVTVNAKGLVTAVSSGTAPVTSVSGTLPVVSSGGATPTISLAANYGDTLNPYAGKTANFVLASPNGISGVPTFRALVSTDVPTLNQNTTGSAATLTTGRTIALTGDVTYTSGSFNGSANVTGTATLASVGTAGTYTKVTTDDKGRVTSATTLAASDIPSLDASKITSGTIDPARLPSYVDDVIEGASLAAFPVTGETGKIYVALDTNKTYRWGGSAYVYITSGAVDSVAGKTGVVALVKGDVGLGSVDNTADSAKNVLSATKLTTARNINGVLFDGTANITVADATKQPLDADLTAIAGLVGTTGLLRKTAADTWSLDTNSYVTSSGVTSVSGTAPIVSSGGTTPAISITAATTSAAGSMSAADKTKLDGIASGATANTGTVTGVTATSPVASSGGTAPVISMAAASSGVNGYMTGAYATKLDGIAAGATNVTNTNQLTNGAGYITSAGSARRIEFIDGPRNLSDRLPNTLARSVNWDFVGAGTGNGAGNYAGVMSFTPWDGTSASTGDSSYQLSFANQSGVNASGPARLSIRNGINSTWNAWQEILTSSNYNSYSPTLTGTGASGTWGINITGNAATITNQANSATTTASTGVTANHIVQRDANGYIYANHINFNTPEAENPTINSFFTSNGDGWSRKSSVAHVKNSIRTVADGTWAISITGNAATATSADQIDGWAFRNTGNNSAVNADTIESNGITYYTAGVTNFSGNATDGALYSQAYSSAWQHQIAGDFRSGQMAVRGKNNGTWQSWRTVIDSGNIANYSSVPTIQTLSVDSNGNLVYDKYDNNSTAVINIKNIPLNFTGSGTLSFSSNDLILTL